MGLDRAGSAIETPGPLFLTLLARAGGADGAFKLAPGLIEGRSASV